jgi:hypothetical protein
MKDLLKNTLLQLYRDDENITEALKQCSWERVQYKFQQELFLRIDPLEFYKMDAILHSAEYARYRESVDMAAMACSNDLSDLIEFVMEQREGGLH